MKFSNRCFFVPLRTRTFYALFALLLFSFTSFLNAQSNCGVLSPHSAPPDSTEILVDRFGNSYLISELIQEEKDAIAEGRSCVAGYFTITTTGLSDSEINTVCEVFTDLSDIVANPNGNEPRIQIKKEAQQGDAIASASGMYRADCGLQRVRLYEIMYTPVDEVLLFSQSVGKIEIDPTINWHTTDNDQSSGSLIPSGSGAYDLYSAVLHEALHVMGFASRIDNNGTPLLDMYGYWDSFLYGTNTNSNGNLIIPYLGDNPLCCDQHEFNSVVFPDPEALIGEDCDVLPRVKFGSSGVTVNAPGGSLPAGLSHLDEMCDNTSYLMHWEIPDEVVKRSITAPEKDILRALGYTIDGNGNTSTECYVDGSYTGLNNIVVEVGSQISIPIDVILNDATYDIDNYSIEFDLTDNETPYISVQGVDTDGDDIFDVLNVTGLSTQGQNCPSVEIPYCLCCTFTNGETYCDDGSFTITVCEATDACPDCACSDHNCDNQLLWGDFQGFTPHLSLFWHQVDLPSYFKDNDINNSPDLCYYDGVDEQNIFIRTRQNESFPIPLCTPLESGCTATVSFKAATKFNGHTLGLDIVGSQNYPCFLIPNNVFCHGNMGVENCSTEEGSFIPYCMERVAINGGYIGSGTGGENDIEFSSTDFLWQDYEVSFENTTGETLNYLFFGRSIGDPTFFDDIEVYIRCTPKLDYTTNPDPLTICSEQGTTESLAIEACITEMPGSNTADLTFDLETPTGITATLESTSNMAELNAGECTTLFYTLIKEGR